MSITYIPSELINLSWLYYLVPPLVFLNEVVVSRFDRNSWLILGVVCLVAALEVFSGGEVLDAPLLLLFSSRNIDFKCIVKNTAIILAAMLCITIGLSLTGLIQNTLEYRENSSVVRYGLGFLGRTFPSYCVLALATQCGYIFKKTSKLQSCVVLVLFVINLFVYIATNTRAGFMLTNIILLIIVSRSKVRPTNRARRLLGIGISIFIPIVAVLSLVVPFIYSPSSDVLQLLDSILSYRISFASRAVSEIGLNLFGHKIPWQSLNYFLDNSYVRIAIDNGLVPLFLIVAGLTAVVVRLTKREELFLAILIIIVATQAVTDPILVTIYFNPFLLLITSVSFWRGADVSSKGGEVLESSIPRS